MANHSKEPWKLFIEFGLLTIRDANGKEVAFTNMQNSPVLANHKRIIACVNACKGIPNEQLNLTPVYSRRKLIEQRDKLFEALKTLYENDMDYIKINNLGGENNQRFVNARKIMSEVEKE